MWIAAIAVVLAAGATFFLAKSRNSRIVVLACFLAAAGAYWVIGRPDMPDRPLAGRLAEIERQANADIDTLSLDQIMALAQKRAQEDPSLPGPHMVMGEILAAAGRPNEAILAYQAALRRDPDFQPAVKSLADLLFKMSGRVDASARQLYHRAYELDPSDLRLGYMAGLGDWQAGERETAEALWADIEARTPEGDPRRQMFQAIRDAFTGEEAPVPTEAPPGN